MPFNPLALEHPRGCDMGDKYVSSNLLHNRRDVGHLYQRPFYPYNSKYNAGDSLGSFWTTPNYTYGCPTSR